MGRVGGILLGCALLAAMLTGCGEVTKYRDPDGAAVYYVDCGNSLRQGQSCRALIDETCPHGFATVPLDTRHVNADQAASQRQWGYFRCLGGAG
jgi:hypothetical protein